MRLCQAKKRLQFGNDLVRKKGGLEVNKVAPDVSNHGGSDEEEKIAYEGITCRSLRLRGLGSHLIMNVSRVVQTDD